MDALQTNIFNLPDEMMMEIVSRLPYVSKFMLCWTCHHLLTCCASLSNKKNRKIHYATMRRSALDSGSIEIVQYLLDLGMQITHKAYVSYTNTNDFDFLLFVRDRCTDAHEKIDDILLRIMLESTNEECIRYALFCEIDSMNIDCFHLSSLSTTSLISLYCNKDQNMLEKMQIFDRYSVLIEIFLRESKLIGKHGTDRLFTDLEPILESPDRWYKIARGVFPRLCRNHPEASKWLDNFFDKGLIIPHRCRFMMETAILTASFRGLLWCMLHKIPFVVGKEETDTKKIFTEKGFIFHESETVSLIDVYLNIQKLYMYKREFTLITKFLIDHGMKIPKNIFYKLNFSKLMNIEAIELLIKAGAHPSKLLFSHIIKLKPEYKSKLIELGFTDYVSLVEVEEDYKNIDKL